MLINDREVLVTKSEVKKNSKDEQYFAIDYVDIDSGDSFNMITKDVELGVKIQKMTKYLVDIEIRSTQYGIKVGISKVSEELGTV